GGECTRGTEGNARVGWRRMHARYGGECTRGTEGTARVGWVEMHARYGGECIGAGKVQTKTGG
ncbi:MAG: hypothetical protein RR821_09750, partial [Clostridia bacterium]